jgi:thymidylate synthase (FAD)
VRFSGEEFAELRRRLEGGSPLLAGKALDRFNEKIKTGKQL